MRKTLLILVFLMAPLIVCLESQKTCSKSDDCSGGHCCIYGKCIEYFGLGCNLCFSDLSCKNGCCINLKCEPESSFKCIEKNRCSANSDCDSSCCKHNKCQATIGPCLMLNVFDKSKCSYSNDCYSSRHGSCCVNGHCALCTQDNSNDNSDTSDDNRESSSSSSIGNSIGIIIIIVIVVIIKIVLCVVCACYSRRRGVIVVRRPVDEDMTVPVVENDQLQREHERSAQETLDCPPPPYTPRTEPWEHGTQNYWQDQDQVQQDGIVHTEEDYGVPQGPLMAPPEYSPRRAVILRENNNLVQTDLIQRAETTGNMEDIDGVPQGSTIVPPSFCVIVVPPPAYSPSIAASLNENANLARTDPRERFTSNSEDIRGVLQVPTVVPPPAYSPTPAAVSSESTNSTQTDQSQRETTIISTEDMSGVPLGTAMTPPPAYFLSPALISSENTN